jgi:hypothetical protein
MSRLVRWSGAGPVRSGASSLLWSGPVRFSIKRTGRTKTEVLKEQPRSCFERDQNAPLGLSSVTGRPRR